MALLKSFGKELGGVSQKNENTRRRLREGVESKITPKIPCGGGVVILRMNYVFSSGGFAGQDGFEKARFPELR